MNPAVSIDPLHHAYLLLGQPIQLIYQRVYLAVRGLVFYLKPTNRIYRLDD